MLRNAFVTLLAGLVALAMAVYAIAKELPVLTYGDQQSLSTTTAIASGNLKAAFSFYGQKRLMAACMQGMTGLWAALAPVEQRIAHAERCLGFATTYTSHTSLEPLTWTVAARASFILGDNEGLNTYLDYAWRAGRNEQWVAGLRVALAEDARPVLSESNQSNHRSDLALMVMSRFGIAAIADRYWSDIDFRERITAIVEKLPEAEQRRFVSSVRRAAPN
jgi:hypothetical protein